MSMSGDSKDLVPLGKESWAWLESSGVLLGCSGGTRQFQQEGQMESLGSCWREECSSQLRLGMLSAVQPSSAPVRGSSDCLGPWLGCLAQGTAHRGWRWREGEAGRDSLFNFLPQVQWEEIHFQHGDSGSVPVDWICPGSGIRDVCKKCGIRMGMWCQWDHPCPRSGEGCIERCCLSLS